MMKGMFVVFEGLDRSGKTTMVNALHERMSKSVAVRKIGFPNRSTALGRVIDGYLRRQIKLEDETIHLVFSADRYEHKQMIEELRKDSVVLCDRYAMSGVVYSAAKGLDLGWCEMTEELLPKPDVTVFIDVPTDELCKRKGFGEEVYDNMEFQNKVYSLYAFLLKKEKNVLIIDGTCAVEDNIEKIVHAIMVNK
ncbi:thymidylate kinase [Ordospora pajunii]|uniref:thymidylate kinase n=1 Tax=Ordospora pajunii TaxID=3039483 RepID=UPI0029527060|nr:thymidylate kinase [Ordospora pajunii]KAH9411575.1 thymidylate kinase [Ordospora pajunii]